MTRKAVKQDPSKLRSRQWFANHDNPNMTALYLERYMNFGLTREELQAGKPIIGIAQSGSDLSPCNRHHLELAHRVREGIREAGGIATSVTSGWWRHFTATLSTAWCLPLAATRPPRRN